MINKGEVWFFNVKKEDFQGMLTKWLPWRWVIRRLARSYGFLDPVSIQSHLHRFAQPAEVTEPIELLRAGMVFHARGLINTRAIQHNLDWIWPYWVERQFNPEDPSFIPRAFSITHVNLTHRNWTAVGTPAPGGDEFPIVDPRGLLTPFWDGWSLDSWILTHDGQWLIPSRTRECDQRLDFNEGLSIQTETASGGLRLSSRTEVSIREGRPVCRLAVKGQAAVPARLFLSVRPYNPEGVSFIHTLRTLPDRGGWEINGRYRVYFETPPDGLSFSDYQKGDVSHRLPGPETETGIHCPTGMATGAAFFNLEPGRPRTFHAVVPYRPPAHFRSNGKPGGATAGWPEVLKNAGALDIPDKHFEFLYQAALRSLVLHSRTEIFPGPFTYKRFWFRDAAFILNALLCSGLTEGVERHLDGFFERQTRSGFFRSQEGEWDSNGEVLWILQRYRVLTGRDLPPRLLRGIKRAAQWIAGKRTSDRIEAPHAGLLPAGFSAEHLGPNDYYYWDDFWSIAGLRAAAEILESAGEPNSPAAFRQEADGLLNAVERSLVRTVDTRRFAGFPASPYRRMDSGAVGSLAGSYPLQILPPRDSRVLLTAEFLLKNCFVAGGFLQDMIHSGINPYLTLHIAQVLLRAGDPRFMNLVDSVANLATQAGQWPEAIHPRTGGGCMGDGHHVWASAEWILMIRNCFIREEGTTLILGSGITDRWLGMEGPLVFGPAPTPFGPVRVRIVPGKNEVRVSWEGRWRNGGPSIQVGIPGFGAVRAAPGEASIVLKKGGKP